ncbi:hypothetical protein [Asticcacaulis endophyticus]|uniref:Uncharacterized protein n=1 Tax=Asticcacaulis endophyticus TaxID=1395890 RepID=A0A918UZ82_9CAUL|nr:hypothetical protein [Asticcacaulis endophyticus]GGZ44454.1 hypothetical protein GCM10011273_34000 [Asticcacaulis endophyticus]
MTDLSLHDAIENIYASLIADNAGLEEHITALKAAMAREGVKEATFEPVRLAQNNRQGRKLMQAFFKKRGVTVVFAA